MKKCVSILIAFLLGIVALFSVAGCGVKTNPPSTDDPLGSTGNQSPTDDPLGGTGNQSPTDDPLAGMEMPSTTNDRLDSTEKQLSYQTNSMTQCTIEKAYGQGWLTKTDLAYAMYYALGEVYMCTEAYWEKNQWEGVEAIEFTPTEQCPEIDKQVELDIKRCRYERMPKKGDLTFEEFAKNYSFRFVGSYNGTFVITDVKSAYWDYPTDVPSPEWVAGFVWYGHYDCDLFVFRYE